MIDWSLVVTYRGDVSKSIIGCGTPCPHRINKDGNTEFVVSGFVKVDCPEVAISLAQQMGVVDECRMHGDIIDLRWCCKKEDA